MKMQIALREMLQCRILYIDNYYRRSGGALINQHICIHVLVSMRTCMYIYEVYLEFFLNRRFNTIFFSVLSFPWCFFFAACNKEFDCLESYMVLYLNKH